MTRSENGQTKPAYRVTVVGDEKQEAQKNEKQQEQKATLFDDASCKSGNCGQKSCGHVGECCCHPYTFRVYGEFLYLRARDAEVCYAVETNSNLPQDIQAFPGVPIQTSPVGVLDQDYSSGFRAGFGICLDECSEIGASYTWFDTSVEDSITRDPNYPIRQIMPMVLHPATADADHGDGRGGGPARHPVRLD